jgi:hypothetical protein
MAGFPIAVTSHQAFWYFSEVKFRVTGDGHRGIGFSGFGVSAFSHRKSAVGGAVSYMMYFHQVMSLTCLLWIYRLCLKLFWDE